jgi:hypothetical protein
VTATAPSFEQFSAEWTLAEGASTTIAVRLRPSNGAPAPPDQDAAEPAGSVLPTLGWIGVAAGGASLIAGTATLLTRNNRRENLRARCPDNVCSPPVIDRAELDDERDSIETLTTATNILFTAGGLLAGAGVTLVVFGSSANSGQSADTALRLRLTPRGATASGAF